MLTSIPKSIRKENIRLTMEGDRRLVHSCAGADEDSGESVDMAWGLAGAEARGAEFLDYIGK